MPTLEKEPSVPSPQAPEPTQPRKEADFDLEGLQKKNKKDWETYYDPDEAVDDLKAGKVQPSPHDRSEQLKKQLAPEKDSWLAKFWKRFK